MIQELFSVGGFAISPFGVMLVLALLAAYTQMVVEMRRTKIGTDDDALSIVIGCGFGGILGGKIYYAILYQDWRLIFSRAGIVWYGCFAAGLLIFLWTVRRRQLPILRMLDMSALCLAVSYGIGRIGCFLVGDDYGRPTDLPWGIAFKNGIPATTAYNLREHFGIDPPPDVALSDFVAVHPTQIYETLIALSIWGFLLWFSRRGPRPGPLPGNVFYVGILLLSLERFFVEILRAKDDRFFGQFTLAQIISMVLVVIMAALFWRNRHDSEPEVAAAT